MSADTKPAPDLTETPEHLRPPDGTDDLEKDVRKQAARADADDTELPEDSPKFKKVYPFRLHWTDGRGKEWVGEFTNRILTVRERSLVGMMRARLAGGMTYSALDPATNEMNLMVSHMQFSLDKEERPEWAKDLREVDDVELLYALYSEVASHEAIFFGR